MTQSAQLELGTNRKVSYSTSVVLSILKEVRIGKWTKVLRAVQTNRCQIPLRLSSFLQHIAVALSCHKSSAYIFRPFTTSFTQPCAHVLFLKEVGTNSLLPSEWKSWYVKAVQTNQYQIPLHPSSCLKLIPVPLSWALVMYSSSAYILGTCRHFLRSTTCACFDWHHDALQQEHSWCARK